MLKFSDYLYSLSYNSSSLNLSYNSLGDHPELLIILSNFLKVNKTIKILNLSNNNLGSSAKNLKILYEGLKNNTTIEEIDLSSNNLGLKEQYKNNGVIGLTLDYEMERIRDNFLWLCESIQDCVSLKTLNLDDNLQLDSLWMGVVKEKLKEKNNFNQNIEDVNEYPSISNAFASSYYLNKFAEFSLNDCYLMNNKFFGKW